jgi:hypothetical protein
MKVRDKTHNRKENGRNKLELRPAAGKISLGAKRSALLNSILKDCGSDKIRRTSTDIFPASTQPVQQPFSESGVKSGAMHRGSRQRPRMVPTLPRGYQPLDKVNHWQCPVQTCIPKKFTRRASLGEHMNVSDSWLSYSRLQYTDSV